MALFLFNSVIGYTFLEEDAFIDFRYAANLVNGHGFVFNPGGETVEGFSNALWLALLFLSKLAGLDLVIAGRFLGIVFGLCTIVFSYFTMKRISQREGYINLLPSFMIAVSPPLLYWYQSGLEPALFSFLLIAAIYFHFDEMGNRRDLPVSGFLLFLLSVTRPEGILFFIIFLVLKVGAGSSGSKNRSDVITWFFLCFLPFLLFLAARYTIFHSFLPNTYYAKVNYSLAEAVRIGLAYTLGFLSDSRAYLWLLPYLLVLFRVGGKARWRNSLPLILVLCYSGFILYVGGDFHIYYRFYAPLLPLLFMTAASGLWPLYDMLLPNLKRFISGLILTIIVFGITFISMVYYRSPAWRDLEEINPMDRSFISYRYAELKKNPGKVKEYIELWQEPAGDILVKTGLWLEATYPFGTRLATEQCGKVPYLTNFETYDLLGLNAKETARVIHYKRGLESYWAEFEKADPQVVLLYFTDEKFVDNMHIGAMVNSARFQSKYRLVKVLDFDYIYNLDREYHRARRMILFEKRAEPVELSEALDAKELVRDFLGQYGDEGRVTFVVEL